jgi:hypothetical protein
VTEYFVTLTLHMFFCLPEMPSMPHLCLPLWWIIIL